MKYYVLLAACLLMGMPAMAQQEGDVAAQMMSSGVAAQCNSQCTAECSKNGGGASCAKMCQCTCHEISHNFSLEELLAIQESNYAFNPKMNAVSQKCGISPDGVTPKKR